MPRHLRYLDPFISDKSTLRPGARPAGEHRLDRRILLHMRSRTVPAMAVVAALWILPAQADTVAEFYKDKTITLLSAGEAGGAHGTYAQLITAHIKKHIPGNPNVIIQYMLGAGGNQAANYLYNVAPKDGTAIGLPLQDLIFNARIGVQAVKYDAAKV